MPEMDPVERGASPADHRDTFVLEFADLDRLIASLWSDGYRVIGPIRQNDAIGYGDVPSGSALPRGLADIQEPGSYRLETSPEKAFFKHTVGPQTWKAFLLPPSIRLWSAEKAGSNGAFKVVHYPPPQARFAFLGIRPCDLAAIRILDRIFLEGPYVNPTYAANRRNALILAVNCTGSAATCFCASTGNGPAASTGFDVVLTELAAADRHVFVAHAGSDSGAERLQQLELRPATRTELETAKNEIANAAKAQERRLPKEDMRAALMDNLEHPRWDDLALRCLSCANCTLVCPTCFCTVVEDATDLQGKTAERIQRWDSCFLRSHSYIHGGSIRSTVRSRYRQWLTHKLASWNEQFGTSGCVGCGRCITWCPVGIDLTEEVPPFLTNTPLAPITSDSAV